MAQREESDGRVPPDMEFDREDGFDEPAPRPKRYEYAWEKVAANARTPVYRSRCTCGIVFGAIDKETLTLMLTTHIRLSTNHHPERAPIELGRNV